MVLNELAQWAVLLLIGFFVFGLTRQLGRFLVQRGGDLTEQIGPGVGERLPRQLLSRDTRRRLQAATADHPTGWAVVIVVDEECLGCEALIEELEDARTVGLGPIVALSRLSSDEHKHRLERVCDFVVVDAEAVKQSGLTVTPFIVIVDGELRVVHKTLSPSLKAAIRRWRGGDHAHGGRNDGSIGLDAVVVQSGKDGE